MEAVKARYQQEQTELEQKTQSETRLITQSTQLLGDALTQQTSLRRQATTETLKLVDEESRARLEAAQRQGQTEEERRTNVRRVDNEILATKRQTLTQALTEYRQHVDALNAEANRHLAKVQRIENEKRQLSMTTEERIREIQRQGMSDFQANEDRKRQIAEYQQKAREALANGELELARQLAQKAMDMAAQVATSQTHEAKRAEEARKQSEQNLTQVVQLETQAREAHRNKEYATADQLMRQADALRAEIAQKSQAADQQAVNSKNDVARAIGAIRTSQDLLTQALDAEAQAHQAAARSAQSARDEIARTLGETTRQIDDITAKLAQGLKVTLEADATRFEQAIAELDRALAEKSYLLQIQADLQQAQQQLKDYEQLLKEGKTLPVDADVTKAREALERLKTYAEQNAQVDLKVATDKAQAAIFNVQTMIQALGRITTESRHTVGTNAGAARAEIMSLNGANTSSTHTIYVRRVETNASGGWVGRTMPGLAGFARLAAGGEVTPGFPRMRAGSVPGSGHHDTVPRTLDAGAFVIRKAAVQRLGASALGRLSQGVANLRSALPRTGPTHSGTDTAPAMLTPGEYVVNRDTVAQYGVGFFEALNQMKVPAQALAARLLPGIRGFATGGWVSPAVGASAVSVARPVLKANSADTADGAPVRKVRVELAAGTGKVSASIDARDESRLLQLLEVARLRAV